MQNYVQMIDANVHEDQYNQEPVILEENQEPEPSLLDLKVKECLEEFYLLMNKKAESQGMRSSNFAVAHGMHNDNNFSTALDIGKLCCYMMKNQKFKEIVKV